MTTNTSTSQNDDFSNQHREFRLNLYFKPELQEAQNKTKKMDHLNVQLH